MQSNPIFVYLFISQQRKQNSMPRLLHFFYLQVSVPPFHLIIDRYEREEKNKKKSFKSMCFNPFIFLFCFVVHLFCSFFFVFAYQKCMEKCCIRRKLAFIKMRCTHITLNSYWTQITNRYTYRCLMPMHKIHKNKINKSNN